MTGRILIPEPLSAERFAPFGDVISSGSARGDSMNEARFDRFSDLAAVDVDGRVSVSIVRSRSPTSLPYHFDRVERHPLGSQAFIPLSNFAFIVVVAPPAESVEPADLLAFITDGRQGINYRRGTWHLPLISLGERQEFLVVDRADGRNNCEERVFDEAVVLESPA